MVTWFGKIPEKCDMCGGQIKSAFVDGKTTSGPWAIMCLTCHRSFGVGFGTGFGQKYERREKDSCCPGCHDSIYFVKVEG